MSIEIRTGIPGDAQESSFENATLQTVARDGTEYLDFSVAVHVEVPGAILSGDLARDQELVADHLRDVFRFLAASPGVHVEIEVGPYSEGEE